MTSNGQLAANELTTVQGNIQLANDAAQDFNSMREVAATQGIAIHVAEPAGGYRSIATQKDMIARPAIYNLNPGIKLASPGNSTHGFGQTVDIVPVSAKIWVENNGAIFGFSRRASNDPNCFKHAPGVHYNKPLAANQRKVVAGGARRRLEPTVNALYNPTDSVKGGSIVEPVGYVLSPLDGGDYAGDRAWLVLSGGYIHVSTVTDASTHDLENLTDKLYPKIVVPPVIVPEPVNDKPENVVPPVIGTEGANVPPILTGAGDTSNVIVTPVTPTPKPVITNPILITDASTLDKLTTALANVLFLTLPKPVRKKVYDYTSKLALIATALGVLGMSTAGIIGGTIGAKIAVGSGILTLISTAMSGLANKLAEKNT